MSKTTVIEPNIRSQLGFFRTILVMAQNISNSKDLIRVLFVRDFLASYKKSFLGVTWLIFTPLLGVVQWVIMNSSGILQPGNVGIPYPAYILVSMALWGLFVGFYTSSVGTLDAGNGFILQVKYAHEALLLKQIAQHFANFIISFAITLVVLGFFHVIPSWKIVYFPIMILPLLFLGAGGGLIVSVLSVVIPEIRRLVDILLGLMVWVTPIIYSKNIENPALKKVLAYNPLTYLIGGARDLMLFGTIDSIQAYSIASISSAMLFLIALRFFYISEEKVLEKML